MSPAQTTKGGAVYYIEFDTAPKLEQCLLDGEGNPVDLTDATVTISIAFAMPRGSYYTSPRDHIAVYSPCVVNPDQVNYRGWVSWTPGDPDSDSALTPPGDFLYQYTVTYDDGGVQSFPPNTYLPLVIKTKVGGRSINP